MAPAVGFEPTTKWLTATYSTAELRRNLVVFAMPIDRDYEVVTLPRESSESSSIAEKRDGKSRLREVTGSWLHRVGVTGAFRAAQERMHIVLGSRFVLPGSPLNVGAVRGCWRGAPGASLLQWVASTSRTVGPSLRPGVLRIERGCAILVCVTRFSGSAGGLGTHEVLTANAIGGDRCSQVLSGFRQDERVAFRRGTAAAGIRTVGYWSLGSRVYWRTLRVRAESRTFGLRNGIITVNVCFV